MPFYIGEYIADTLHLNTEQHGAYVLMMLHAWRNGGYIPKDPKQLGSITKLSSEAWKANGSVLLSFWFDSDKPEFLSQKRLLEELRKAKSISLKRRKAGKLGGRPKNQTESKLKANGLAKDNQNETHSHSHSQDHIEPSASENLPVELPPGFPTTEAEAKACAAISGVPEDFAAQVWNKAMSRGGTDAKGQPVRSFRHYLSIEFSYEKQRTSGKPNGKRGIDRSKGTLNEGTASDYAQV